MELASVKDDDYDMLNNEIALSNKESKQNIVVNTTGSSHTNSGPQSSLVTKTFDCLKSQSHGFWTDISEYDFKSYYTDFGLKY